MLCCRPKKDSYSVEAEEASDATKKLDGKQNDSNNKGDNSKVTDNKGSESTDKTDDDKDGVKEVVESAVEVKVTETVSAAPNEADKGTNKGSDDIDKEAEDRVGGPLSSSKRYATQTSISSQLSTREDIYRSREEFFSRHSLNESLQEYKVYLTNNEKFAAYQRRYRPLSQDCTMSVDQINAVVQRLETVATKLESLAVSVPTSSGGGSGGSAASDVVTPMVLSFDAIVNGEFAKFMDLSNKIGGDLQTQAAIVKSAFQAQRDLLVVASKSKKPSDSDLPALIKPLSDKLSEVQSFRESNRTSPLFNHLSTLSESIVALGWVAVAPTPGPYVKDMQDAGMFYSNRVLKDFKEKDQDHLDWTKAWNGTLRELISYIKEYHTTGLSWNPQGGDAKAAVSSAPAPPPPAGGAPPPPPAPGPPPPPPPASMPSGGADTSADDARAALFDSINKGANITSGLKHVSDDMKTHKNPALKASSTVPGVRAGPAPFKAAGPPPVSPKPNSKPASKPASAPAAKPPVFELQDKKWMVEYQVGNKTMVIDQTNLKQVVYLYKCQDSTIQIKGKINSITVDSCKKVAVAFDDAVSSIEFVNCQSVQAQVMGKCPTVSIDKTDGCQMYLSKDSVNAEIVTAKSSEMNILVPKEDGDFVEYALPEQFKSTWNGSKFSTSATESV